VVTETVFSMDGDIAPLEEIYSLCLKHEAYLYVDDAHGTGVMGGGRGALSHLGLRPEPWVIQMGTYSKALGSLGGFVSASRQIVDLLINRARSFIYSTTLPAMAAAASLKALDLIESEPARPSRIDKLWENRRKLAGGLDALGLDTGASETPIMPLMADSVEAALALSAGLFEMGIYAPAIRPPTVARPRLRLSVTAAHRDEDIEKLIDGLRALLK